MLTDRSRPATGVHRSDGQRTQDRLLSLSFYAALAFIATLVVATLPHTSF